nr:MAG TPA: cysteine-rich protein [Caudoviricetes sp.]
MSDEKRPVICPYCGGEMRHKTVEFQHVLFHFFECEWGACGGTSPKHLTLGKAYKAAMTRWQEPNKVLTLEELQTYIGYAWYEGDHKWYHSSFDYPVWIEDGKYNYEGDLYDIPDVEGRFWLRKPTKNEQENTPWEDEGR